jgi:nucleoside-diphosphate-sugar epimerase
MKTVAITGGFGFIGHHLAKTFLERRWNVIIIDDLSLHEDAYLTKYRMESIQNKKCQFINASCNHAYDIKNKLRGEDVNAIVHLASIPNQKMAIEMPSSAVHSITGNTLIMSSIATEIYAKFVHVSSSMAYGHFTSSPQKEDAILAPTNLYGTLKSHSEDIVKLFSENYTIIRPSAVYGPGDNFDRVIGKWIMAALNGEEIIVNDPARLMDFTYVTDLVQGIFAATAANYKDRTYNITRGQARSLGEAVLLVKTLTESKSPVHYTNATVNEPVRGALDISKAKEELGYSPKIDLQEGIENYIAWVRRYKNVY